MSRKIFWKTFYLLANPVRKFYWFLIRPNTRGVKVLVEYQGKFLLTRLSYAHKLWTIPGGGVKRNESYEDAARRETEEEVGISVSDIKKISEYTTIKEYKNDTVEVFFAKVSSPDFKIDELEISEANWFSENFLPKDRTVTTDKIIKMYKDFLTKTKK